MNVKTGPVFILSPERRFTALTSSRICPENAETIVHIILFTVYFTDDISSISEELVSFTFA